MVRTTFALAIALALALSAAFFAGSGFNAIVSGESNTGQLTEKMDRTANKSDAGQGALKGSQAGTSDSSIVGMAISGARSIGRFTGLILLLPLTLRDLGFPGWFAFPVGSVLEILVSIGMIQFIAGRVWQ